MRTAFHLAAIHSQLPCWPARRGPPTRARAAELTAARVEAITAGDLAGTVAPYTERSTLEWVGGPLDGSHATPERREEVWGRFAKAQGPLGEASHGANPSGAKAVSAEAFRGAAGVVKVRHVTVWRDGTVVNELWQVDPGLAV